MWDGCGVFISWALFERDTEKRVDRYLRPANVKGIGNLGVATDHKFNSKRVSLDTSDDLNNQTLNEVLLFCAI